jgi:hypothetical protein
VTGVSAAVAMISNPVAGTLSDRTTGRLAAADRGSSAARWSGAAALALLAASTRSRASSAGLGPGRAEQLQASLTAAVPNQVPVAAARRGVRVDRHPVDRRVLLVTWAWP